MSKQIPIAKPSVKGKAIALMVLVIGLYLVITDPVGSAETVSQVVGAVQIFSAVVAGGGQP